MEEFIADAIESLKDGITEGLSEFIFSFLYMLFYQPLRFFATLLDSILIEPSSVTSNFLTSTSLIINSMISGIAITIMIFKMLQVMKSNAEGNAESPGYYLAQIVPMFIAIITLPWLVDILTEISYSLTRALLETGNSDYLETIESWKNLKTGKKSFGKMIEGVGVSGGSIVMFIVFIFMLLVFTLVFIFQFVSRIADLVVMKLLAPLIAVSLLADENNYLSVWWRELLAISVQLPLQVMSFYMGINLVFGAQLDAGKLLLGIGFFIITVKSPSFIRSMVYSTGTGRSAMGAGSSVSKLLIRQMILKK